MHCTIRWLMQRIDPVLWGKTPDKVYYRPCSCLWEGGGRAGAGTKNCLRSGCYCLYGFPEKCVATFPKQPWECVILCVGGCKKAFQKVSKEAEQQWEQAYLQNTYATPPSTEISCWQWQESCNFFPKNKNNPHLKFNSKEFELFQGVNWLTVTLFTSDILCYVILHYLLVYLLCFIYACLSTHRFVCTKMSLWNSFRRGLDVPHRSASRVKNRKSRRELPTLKTVKWLLNPACGPWSGYPRSLCPQDQWWPNCWVWHGTYPETLIVGSGPWSSEMGISGLDHTDYILGNKQCAQSCSLALKPVDRSGLGPFWSLTSHQVPWLHQGHHQRWTWGVVLLYSNSFTMQQHCLEHWYLS